MWGISSISPHWDSKVDFFLMVIVFTKACQTWAFYTLYTFSLSLLSSVFLSLSASPSMSLFFTHKQAVRKPVNYFLGTLHNKGWALPFPVELRCTALSFKETGISSDNMDASFCYPPLMHSLQMDGPSQQVLHELWSSCSGISGYTGESCSQAHTLYLPLLWAATLARKQPDTLWPHQHLLFSAEPFTSGAAFATINQSKQTPFCSFPLCQLPSSSIFTNSRLLSPSWHMNGLFLSFSQAAGSL